MPAGASGSSCSASTGKQGVEVKMRAAAGSLVVAFVFVLSAPASAQTGPSGLQSTAAAATSGSSGGDYAAEIDGGVTLVNRVTNRGESNTYKGGFHLGASYRLIHVISIIAEFSGDYDKRSGYTANIYAYSGGARFESTARGERVKPFAQVLIGGAQDNGSGNGTINHYPMVSPGGGVDLLLARHLAARVRVDFPLYMTFGDVFKGSRLSIGVAVPFGTR
jgi:hypothetical protein